MNRYGPGRFQRVLTECPRNRFGNFFCLLVDGVFDVAPRLFFHLYLVSVFPDYRDFVRVDKDDLSDLSIVVTMISRRIVLNEHHLGTAF